MQAIHKQIAKQIKKKNKEIAIYNNIKRKNRPQLKKGDKVYLLTKNIKSKRLSKKLGYIKVGPFLVKQQKGLVNYELDLPKDTNIHLVFYILLLELADAQTPLQETFHFKGEEEYEVKRILGQNSQRYLVRQKGCDSTKDTQELLRNLRNYQDLVRRYHLEKRGRRTS